MAVYSMTGFASLGASMQIVENPMVAAYANGDRRAETAPVFFEFELRSVNSRFFDFSYRSADALRPYEANARTVIGKNVRRGKVELRVAVRQNPAEKQGLPSLAFLQQAKKSQLAIQAVCTDAAALSVSELMHLWRDVGHSDEAGLTSLAKNPECIDAGIEQTQPCDFARWFEQKVVSLVHLLDQARASEGEKLKQMMLINLATLENLRSQALAHREAWLIGQQQKSLDLAAQFGEIFLARIDPSWMQASLSAPERQDLMEVLQKKALEDFANLSLRSDVAEELSRLQAHVDEARNLLNKGGVIGKRLDFVIQELHREANTLGSKAESIEHTHLSVEMRVQIEQLREQVQNLE